MPNMEPTDRDRLSMRHVLDHIKVVKSNPVTPDTMMDLMDTLLSPEHRSILRLGTIFQTAVDRVHYLSIRINDGTRSKAAVQRWAQGRYGERFVEARYGSRHAML